MSGLRSGEVACLSGVGAGTRVTGPGGAVSLKLPAATKNHVLTLSSVGAPVTVTVRALGATKLRIAKSAKVTSGKKQRAKVSGLAAGERVKVFVKGKRVDGGTANKNGVFRAVFKVRGKVGKRVLSVRGQFTNRTGRTTFKVVR